MKNEIYLILKDDLVTAPGAFKFATKQNPLKWVDM